MSRARRGETVGQKKERQTGWEIKTHWAPPPLLCQSGMPVTRKLSRIFKSSPSPWWYLECVTQICYTAYLASWLQYIIILQNYLAHDELSIAVEMLSAVVLLNQTLENKDIPMIKNHLRDPCIGFNNLEEENLQR